MANAALSRKQGAKAYLRKLGKDIWRDGDAYLLVVPVLLYFFLFHYKSMYGAIIAFKDFAPMRGILGSPWADNYGFAHFISFFESYYFGRLLRNTITISLATLVFGFPAPIILALLLNEVRSTRFKRFVQTITYMPHFISMVVICSMIRMFVAENGVITQMLLPFGIKQGSMLSHPEYFVPLYVISGIWQEIGWGSIIYLAALTGIDQELYEAAMIDGAGRLQRIWYITVPGLVETYFVLLIISFGNFLNTGMEQYYVFQNAMNQDYIQVLDLYVYNQGIKGGQVSYATAIGTMKSLIALVLFTFANILSKKVRGTSVF